LKKRRELTSNKFNVDVTSDLATRLDTFLTNLDSNTFEYLPASVKASILAYMCDELLSTSCVTDLNNLQNNQELMIANEDDDQSCVVYELDEAIEEFFNLKQEICQLDSKRRQLKTEKQTALAVVNEKDNGSKLKAINKLDKSLAQLEKKRHQLKSESEMCSNKLRSGRHLGQDRFNRHYWSLQNCGGLLLEAGKRPVPGSMFFSEDDWLMVSVEESCDVTPEGDIVSEVIQSMVDKVAAEFGEEPKVGKMR